MSVGTAPTVTVPEQSVRLYQSSSSGLVITARPPALDLSWEKGSAVATESPASSGRSARPLARTTARSSSWLLALGYSPFDHWVMLEEYGLPISGPHSEVPL